MKTLVLLFLLLFLFACAEQVNETPSVESDSETEAVQNDTLDVTQQQEKLDEQNARVLEAQFAEMQLEDYAKLKTRQDVLELFGAEAIENGESWYGEGTMRYAHSLVTNPKTGHVIKYLWSDKDTNTLSFIEVPHKVYDENFEVTKKQMVHSESGIYTGMPIRELAKWNEGVEINFSGFGWDFHGMVHGQDEPSKLKASGLSLQMDEDSDTGGELSFLGDVTLSSTDENVLNSQIVVGMITIDLE